MRMALQYIFGGAGSGKTAWCQQEIAAKIKTGGARQSLIYIVPEQFTLESEKQLCNAISGGAIMNLEVLSFQRLAYRLFAETTGPNGKTLDDAGKHMLLQKITLELANELHFFGKAATKQGFIDNLSAAIREFFQYCVDPQRLLEAALAVEDKEGLRLKMLDLHKLYSRYVQTLQAGYISTEHALDFVPARIDASSFLVGASIWVDGFNGFTPQEYNMIARLMAKADKLTVTLTVKSDRIAHDNLKAVDPFYETKTTVNQLTRLARENNIAIEPPVYLTETPRFQTFPELAFLEKNFFNYHRNHYPGPVANIALHAAQNIHGEITHAANTIMDMAQNQGFHYHHIALVSAGSPEVERAVASVFTAYGIPYFVDKKSSILAHPLTELIRAAVDVAAYHWTYEGVFRFLKTTLTPLTRDEVDTLENYVLAYGIKGFKWTNPDMVWQHGFEEGFFDESFIQQCRGKVTAALSPFTGVCSGNKTATVKAYAMGLFHMLAQLQVPEALARWAEEAAARGEQVVARQHTQIWGKVTDLFEKLVDILGNVVVTPKAFGQILEAGFNATDMGLIPPCQDQVVVGDLERSRLPDIKALILVGVNEGILPGIKKEIGLFADDERLLLRRMGMELAPDSRRKSYEEQLLIYEGLMKPTQRLVLSYSQGTLAGKSMRPSALIATIKRLFPALAETKEQDMPPAQLPVPLLGEMGALLRTFGRSETPPGHLWEAYAFLKNHPQYRHQLSAMERLRFNQATALALNSGLLDKHRPYSVVPTSISRLEQYVRCPFAYFVQYDLKAAPRKLYEAGAVDYGNFFHLLLEAVALKLAQEGKSFRSLAEADIEPLVEGCVADIAPMVAGQVLLSTARFQYMLRRLSRMSKRSVWALSKHVRQGDFEPAGFEVAFGDGSPLTAIEVAVNEKQVFKLTGRIDRVDVAEVNGEHFIKIIDYKSGNVKFDINDVYFGLQLQLLAYMDALVKNGREVFGAGTLSGHMRPGGVFYFHIDDPMIQTEEALTTEKLEALLLSSFKMSGLTVKDETVVRAIDREVNGHSGVLPVYLTGNGFGKASQAVSPQDFDHLRQFVGQKMQQVGQSLLGGDISIAPYKKADGSTGCDFCGFKAICQIEAMKDKNPFRPVARGKFDTVMENIRENKD